MIIPDHYNEKELLLKLREGNHIAFDKLYKVYSKKITANLFKLLKSWDQAEDALQELFGKVWENREKIDPDKSFQSYLYKIAANIVNDYYRSIARDKELAGKFLEQIATLYNADSLHVQVQLDDELMRTIEKLPPQRKIIFKLCKLEGKSYAEVSKLLSISEVTIGDHISKANKFIHIHYDKSIITPILLYFIFH